MNIPTIDHPTDRPNFAIVRVKDTSLAFSYKVVVGYKVGWEWVVRQNEWGPTTGKHLNWLEEDKSKRIPGPEFEEQLKNLFYTRQADGQYV